MAGAGGELLEMAVGDWKQTGILNKPLVCCYLVHMCWGLSQREDNEAGSGKAYVSGRKDGTAWPTEIQWGIGRVGSAWEEGVWD